MTAFFRYLLFLGIFVTVLSVERTLGLPIISLVIASNYVAPLGRVGKSVGILLTGIALAASYFIPLWLGIALVGVLVFVLEQRFILFHRETLTYFAAVLVAAVFLAIVSKLPLSPTNMVYHVLLALGCLFLIRFWFMKRTNKWKMY